MEQTKLATVDLAKNRYPDHACGICDPLTERFVLRDPLPAKSRLTLHEFPHPILRTRSSEVGTPNAASLGEVAMHMVSLMHEHEGIGLAANQAGLGYRMFTAQILGLASGPMLFIDPVIESMKDQIIEEEGCLSLPEIRAQIKRAKNIEFSATNLKNERYTLKASVLFSVCVQHEIDHLNGIVFIDYLSKLKREMYVRKLRKLKRNANS